MSMVLFDATPTTTTPAGDQEANRRWWASALARYTAQRRQELGLTIAEAAELAGLEISQWCALEDGWVPEDRNIIRAIAATLRIRWTEYHVLAFLAGCHQQCC